MRPPIRPIAALLALAIPSAGVAAPARFPRLTHLRPIVLHSGVNPIPHMTADGREGMIVEGYKNCITVDCSYGLFVVMTHDPPPEGGNWAVTSIGKGHTIGRDDPVTLTDNPHLDDDVIRSVRFARADVDGRPAFIALVAERDLEGTEPSPSHVTIRLYVLGKDQDVDGDRLILSGKMKTAKCYGNADLALEKTLGLPLPPGYEGPKAAGVCGAE